MQSVQRAPAQAMAPKIDLKMLIMRSLFPQSQAANKAPARPSITKVKLRKDPRKHHEETVCPTVIPLEHTRLVPTTNIQLTGEAGVLPASERFRRREKACGVLPNCIDSNLRSCMIVLAYMSAHAHAFDAMRRHPQRVLHMPLDGLVCRTWSYM